MIDTEKLTEVAREELARLWSDLETARQHALNGQWSVACDDIEERIKALTPLIGPTPWGDIQIPLLELGIYQRIHADLGIDGPDVGVQMNVHHLVRMRVHQS
ncbi:hypothetical protein ACFYO9_33870 [Streptomyces sp. NPDC005863]|uniref:hypothetical protein n=1 Tax=Streptomyces sp. NPDC005863 TaxID=3364735 RepID=UPI0036B3F36A